MTSKELQSLYNQLDKIHEIVEKLMKDIDSKYVQAVIEEKANDKKDKL